MTVVGFDLDATLIDSKPQILAAFEAVGEELRVAIDVAAIESRLGLKLEDELGHWVAPHEITAAATAYRRHYIELARATEALPGAHAALAAVRASGARAAIVTAKHHSTVDTCLAAAGLEVDEVVAFVHGPEKAVALTRLGAGLYVGDTLPDMQAAASAGIDGLGVATGPCTEAALLAAGATAALATLETFPEWYAGYVSRVNRA